MREYKPKQCKLCNTTYTPTGNCSKYCSECRIIAIKRAQVRGQEGWRRRQGMRIGRGALTGKDNPQYSHGRCTFARWAREKRQLIGICEHCGKDIREAGHYEWVGHHKDHNRMNNTIDNLIILCKRCHQIEHKCWKAFGGVTTIQE